MKQYIFKATQGKLASIWMTVLLSALLSHAAIAQNGRVSKTEMKRLSHWVGAWKGQGWQMDQATRQRINFTVEEIVESKLDGMVILVEGKGKSGESNFLGHHAIGMIYYNLDQKTYELKSITQEGNMTLAKARIADNGDFIWGFDVPGGKIQFTITLTEDTWVEKGAFSMDGSTWYPVMEMTLKKAG